MKAGPKENPPTLQNVHGKLSPLQNVQGKLVHMQNLSENDEAGKLKDLSRTIMGACGLEFSFTVKEVQKLSRGSLPRSRGLQVTVRRVGVKYLGVVLRRS